VVAQEAIGGVGAVVVDQVPAHVAEVDADGTPRGVGPITTAVSRPSIQRVLPGW
jgi:hypothetical protein